MKVLDLKCSFGHPFEGWFASEAEFAAQCLQSLVKCPVCGDPSVTKALSAPRLRLAGRRADPPEPKDNHERLESVPPQSLSLIEALQALTRQVVAQTTDVGDRFAEVARKVHYGEQEPRGLRGTATIAEARSLVEEGIEVLPFPMPHALKGRLH